jgi:hypothetical protein
MGMIHLIRLDNPQYYLRKFCDDSGEHWEVQIYTNNDVNSVCSGDAVTDKVNIFSPAYGLQIQTRDSPNTLLLDGKKR